MTAISFVPRMAFGSDQSVSLYGRLDPAVRWEDGPKVGAVITAASRCTRCGGPFLAGHAVTADLKPNMAGTTRHTDCDDPKLERQP